MPYVSDAQRRYFHAALNRGEISKKTVSEFDSASKGRKLPEHVKKMSMGGEVQSEMKEHGDTIKQIISDTKEGTVKPIEYYAAKIVSDHDKFKDALRKKYRR